jgi:hypothetical protein
MVLITYRLVCRADTTLNYGTDDPGSIPGAVHFWSRWYTCAYYFCMGFSASDGNSCFISLNHMLRNLGRALLSVFSSVSVEIALWRQVFLGLDGFFHSENRVFPRICVTEHSTLRECQSM